jgi:endonuclease YncB( thermonuclease family)
MKRRRRQGFWARWGLPLIGGPAVTAIALGWVWMTAEPTGGTAPRDLAAVQPAAAGDADLALEAPPLRLRDVTPEGVTPGPAAEGPMLRLPAATTAAPDEALPVPDVVYGRIVVLDARTFRTVKEGVATVVTIAGIATPAFSDTCTAPDGAVWKCGAKARAELARLIGGKSVSCVFVDETDPAAPTARCSVGRFDLARWLVEQGWADPADPADAELGGLATDAKAARRGRFGPAPMGVIAG